MPAADRARKRRTAPSGRVYASVNDVADIFGVDPRTVRRWILDGKVTGYRLGGTLIKLDLVEVEHAVLEPVETLPPRPARRKIRRAS